MTIDEIVTNSRLQRCRKEICNDRQMRVSICQNAVRIEISCFQRANHVIRLSMLSPSRQLKFYKLREIRAISILWHDQMIGKTSAWRYLDMCIVTSHHTSCPRSLCDGCYAQIQRSSGCRTTCSNSSPNGCLCTRNRNSTHFVKHLRLSNANAQSNAICKLSTIAWYIDLFLCTCRNKRSMSLPSASYI